MPHGQLYVVATPIGNLEDISARALRVLREADLIAAEDTRHSAKLLDHFGIHTPLMSYHEHNETARAEELVAALRTGKNIALITDAGTPCISDPGYRVVRAAHEAGISVMTVPGPSSVVAALSISGLPTDRYTFHGFFPRKHKHVDELFDLIRNVGGTHIFFEAPSRLLSTLAELNQALGSVECCVARELTKMFEEAVPGSPSELIDYFSTAPVRGECVVMVHVPHDAAHDAARYTPEIIQEKVQEAMAREGLSRRDAIRQVAGELHLPRNVVYAAATHEAP